MSAQNNNREFQHFTIKSGLSDNNIKDIAQDEFGYIWIATEYGLCRYNGTDFRKFYAQRPPLNLPGNNITHLKYLGKHEMGVSTSTGFMLLNTKTFKSQILKVADTGSISAYQNNTWDCMLLPNDQIGISTSTGFYVFNRSGGLNYRYDRYTASDLNKRMIWGKEIYKISDSRLLIIGEPENYAVYDINKEKLELYEHGDKKLKEWPFLSDKNWRRIKLSESELIMAHQLTDSVFYLNLKTGYGLPSKLPFPLIPNINWNARARKLNDTVFYLNLISGGIINIHFNPVTKIVVAETQRKVSHLRSFCYFTDNEERLWVGTTNGLYQQLLRVPALEKVIIPNLYGEDTYATAALHFKNKVFISCFNKRSTSLKIFNEACDSLLRELSFFETGSGWNQIISLASYLGDTLLLGTESGVLCLNINDYVYKPYEPPVEHRGFFKQPNMILLAPDNDGWYWMYPKHGAVVGKYHPIKNSLMLYDNKSKPMLPITDVKHFVIDNNKNIWMGGRGLCRYNRIKNEFDTVVFSFAGRNKYNPNITNLGIDNAGDIYIQTGDNDLLKYQPLTKKFSVFNAASGFPEGVNNAMSVNPDSQLLIAYSNRLIQFNTVSRSYRSYGYSSGYPEEKPVSETKIYYDRVEGRYFIMFPKTAAVFKINNLYLKQRSLLINEVVINNKRFIFHPESRITTSFQENKISINYTVNDFENADEYTYYYKLDDGEWIYNSTYSTVELGSVENGLHKVFVKGIDTNGRELVVKQEVYVEPPFWKRWWFLLLTSVLISSAVVLLYRFRIGVVRNKAILDINIKEMEMRALQAQMNPHFIFNALNSIKEMILTDKKNEASRYLSKFGHLVRLNLEHNKKPFITLAENNQHLSSYLEMESLRFANLNWSIHVEEGLNPDDVLIPPMLIQPFAENALWHGLLQKTNAPNVSIRYSRRESRLLCKIEDNGVGIERSLKLRSSESHNSVGLSNIKNRLDLLSEKYGESYTVKISDKLSEGRYESGTIVILSLPVSNKF